MCSTTEFFFVLYLWMTCGILKSWHCRLPGVARYWIRKPARDSGGELVTAAAAVVRCTRATERSRFSRGSLTAEFALNSAFFPTLSPFHRNGGIWEAITMLVIVRNVVKPIPFMEFIFESSGGPEGNRSDIRYFKAGSCGVKWISAAAVISFAEIGI